MAPPARRPVHTAYVGAHLFQAGLAAEWGKLALQVLADYASDAQTLAAEDIWSRVRDKLEREPIEDLRIDFEDGYGEHTGYEEDATARAAGAEVAAAMALGNLPPFVGLRVKPARAERTLELLLRSILEGSGGTLPAQFVVTLPKVASADEVTALVHVLDGLEARLHLDSKALALELMVETPLAIMGTDGRCPLPEFVAAARGRCRGAHFGVYDYSSALGIAPAQHGLRHPACDHARQVMQVAAVTEQGAGVRVAGGDGRRRRDPADGDRGRAVCGLDERVARPAARERPPRLAAALQRCAALARERVLSRMGLTPRAAGDALRGGVHVLQRVVGFGRTRRRRTRGSSSQPHACVLTAAGHRLRCSQPVRTEA